MFFFKANLMQVPSTITLNNGNTQHMSQRNPINYFVDNATFPMEMPDKLTSKFFINKKTTHFV